MCEKVIVVQSRAVGMPQPSIADVGNRSPAVGGTDQAECEVDHLQCIAVDTCTAWKVHLPPQHNQGAPQSGEIVSKCAHAATGSEPNRENPRRSSRHTYKVPHLSVWCLASHTVKFNCAAVGDITGGVAVTRIGAEFSKRRRQPDDIMQSGLFG